VRATRTTLLIGLVTAIIMMAVAAHAQFSVPGRSVVTLAALLLSPQSPSISSGFGTSPSIVVANGTGAFTLNVGTGGAATSGVIGLPTARTGWFCNAVDQTNNTVTRQTATTTSTATLTAAAAWAASDVLQVSCLAY
jgi:hypothetical protein